MESRANLLPAPLNSQSKVNNDVCKLGPPKSAKNVVRKPKEAQAARRTRIQVAIVLVCYSLRRQVKVMNQKGSISGAKLGGTMCAEL
eukprot:3615405-Amphidinium_carterae.1